MTRADSNRVEASRIVLRPIEGRRREWVSDTIIIGVDPGVGGAWAALDCDLTWVAIGDLPYKKPERKLRAGSKGMLTERWLDIEQLNRNIRTVIEPLNKAIHVVIEQPITKDGQAPAGALLSGASFGLLVGNWSSTMADALTLPTPGEWKKGSGLSAQKDYSRERAMELFPEVEEMGLLRMVQDHDRAEALLIADWGRRVWERYNSPDGRTNSS